MIFCLLLSQSTPPHIAPICASPLLLQFLPFTACQLEPSRIASYNLPSEFVQQSAHVVFLFWRSRFCYFASVKRADATRISSFDPQLIADLQINASNTTPLKDSLLKSRGLSLFKVVVGWAILGAGWFTSAEKEVALTRVPLRQNAAAGNCSGPVTITMTEWVRTKVLNPADSVGFSSLD